MHDNCMLQNNTMYGIKMLCMKYIVQLFFLCTISLTTIAGLKPTTNYNQTLLPKQKQEGTTTEMTPIPGHELKHHNQTLPKSKYEGGPSWLLNVPQGWGTHHSSSSIQRQENTNNDTHFGQTFLQRFDELVEQAFDDGETFITHPFTYPRILAVELTTPANNMLSPPPLRTLTLAR